MKQFILAFALALQLTGLSTHLNASAHQQLAAATVLDVPTPLRLPSAPIPVQTGQGQLALTPGESAYAVDLATMTPLYSQNAAAVRPIASITKLVTVMTVLSRHDASETVTIGKLPTYQPEDDTLGFVTGETYKLGDLVSAALIPSANDAADALAIYDSGSVAAFTKQMNAYVAGWGITGATFTSASGLQDTGNGASAIALARIAAIALTNPTIKTTIAQPAAVIASGGGHRLNLSTTNELLSNGQFYGIKTGYTEAAGQCFLGLTRIGGHEVVTVILGSADRFGDTSQLVTWIGQNWQWL